MFIFAGYIIGFPADTKASVLRDIEIIKRELPIDVLEFFYLTPLPGSEDHRRMLEAGEWMDPDLNKYDLNHRVSHHPKMSDEEWEEAFNSAWRAFFNDAHMETVGRRHAARADGRPKKAMQYLNEFRAIYEIEGIHPLESGILRRRRRRSRRPGLALRAGAAVLPALRREIGAQGGALHRPLSGLESAVQAGADRPRAAQLYRRRDPPGFGRGTGDPRLVQETTGGEAFVARKVKHDAIIEAATA